jgi:hypothetical protein
LAVGFAVDESLLGRLTLVGGEGGKNQDRSEDPADAESHD